MMEQLSQDESLHASLLAAQGGGSASTSSSSGSSSSTSDNKEAPSATGETVDVNAGRNSHGRGDRREVVNTCSLADVVRGDASCIVRAWGVEVVRRGRSNLGNEESGNLGSNGGGLAIVHRAILEQVHEVARAHVEFARFVQSACEVRWV